MRAFFRRLFRRSSAEDDSAAPSSRLAEPVSPPPPHPDPPPVPAPETTPPVAAPVPQPEAPQPEPVAQPEPAQPEPAQREPAQLEPTPEEPAQREPRLDEPEAASAEAPDTEVPDTEAATSEVATGTAADAPQVSAATDAAELGDPVRPPRYVRPRSARPRRVEPAPLDADQASSLLLQLATERLPSDVARDLLGLARPTLGLTAVAPSGDVSVASRLGGLPLLPPRMPWPEHEGRPLHFVGQVDLAETSVHDTDLTLPRFGVLGFFYLPEDDLWGYDPDDRTGWRVVRTDASLGQPRPAPEDVEVYETRQLVPRATWTVPDATASVLGPLRARGGEAVDEVLEAFGQASGRTRHQLLGWPSEGQDAMARAAAAASSGRFAGVGVDETADPSGWQLLLQVDSDDEAGMVWGDDCRLCFWLPTQSLVTGRLSDAWMLMRCG